ncbi:MAG: hypothetical protein GF417_11620, partial [Candidatus Latescibacteria bacterium]|nr:hypothetical protein [bacterium]MBD3425073.1 hypothetical protein [Candidatus Latescibacterota bacterium]
MRFPLLIAGTLLLVASLTMDSTPGLAADDLPRNLRFRNYSLEKGLSQGNVYDVTQDSIGFIWIGTQDGLNRFDGVEFRVYNHDPSDSNSLSDNKVNCLEAGSGEKLWIGTDFGLNLFSPLRGEFRRFLPRKGDPSTISSALILDILCDSRGALWVATAAGLDRMEGMSGKFEHFVSSEDDDSSLPPGEINSLFEDSEGHLWICTESCLARFDRSGERFRCFRPLGEGDIRGRGNSVTSMVEHVRGSFLVGTRGGLFSFNFSEGSFRREIIRCLDGSSYNDLYVEDICRDSSGRIWIATVGYGVIIYNPDRGISVKCSYDQENPNSLSYNILNCVFEDRGEVIWIGTRGYGLSAWSPYFDKFDRFTMGNSASRGMGVRSVRAIYEQPGGDLWVGGYYGLDRLDTEELSFENFENLPAGNIYVIQGDPRKPDSLIWLGTEGKGLIQYDIASGEYIHYPFNLESPEGLSDRFVYSICPDRSSGLYLGTSSGISRFDFRTETFRALDSPGREVKVRSLMVDSEGSLWAGTEIGPAVRTAGSDSFTFFGKNPRSRPGISTGAVLSICQGLEEMVWFGTAGGGLSRLNRESGEFRTFTAADGLPNNVVYGIVLDSGGNLWLSTNSGISSFNPKAGLFRNYGMEDGLQSMEFNSGAYHRGFSGKIYFGGING